MIYMNDKFQHLEYFREMEALSQFLLSNETINFD